MQPVNRILVPVDLSTCSRAAVDYAVRLAEALRATIDVLYVDEAAAFVAGEAFAALPASAPRAWEDTRRDLVKEVEGFLGPQRQKVAAVRVEQGLPADLIPAVAKKGEFELIVMGTNGRTGLSRLVVGSVAEAVLRKSHVPVLTLRLPKREPRERIPL
jgi:nucleotide-binding universal stress UspA family protein